MTANNVLASATRIDSSSNQQIPPYCMQLGPDNKLYYYTEYSHLGQIADPNIVGVGCNSNKIFKFIPILPGWTEMKGFPQFFESANDLDENTSFNADPCDLNSCFSYSGDFDCLEWNFGDPSTGSNDTAYIMNPCHTFSAPGSYTVTLIASLGCHCEADTISQVVTVNAGPSVTLAAFNQDTVCNNNNPINLPAGTPSGGTYSGNGVTGGTFDPNLAGAGTHTIYYTYQDSATECSATDSTIIHVDVCAGIYEYKQLMDFSVYPNPINNGEMLTIIGNGNVQNARLVNVLGANVPNGLVYYGEPIQGKCSFLLDTSPGMYFVVLGGKNSEEKSIKIIVR